MKPRGAKRARVGVESMEGRLLTTSLAGAMARPAAAVVQKTSGAAGAKGDRLKIELENILVTSHASKVKLQDIHFTTKVNKPSPSLH